MTAWVRKGVLGGLVLLGLALALGCVEHRRDGHDHASDRHGAHQAERQHQGHHRGPADIQEYLAKLDRPERDAYQKPRQVIDALQLTPGMAIADVGAGSGYFTRRFVEAVGHTGTVYAIDVEQDMLDYVKNSLKGIRGASSTHFILTRPDALALPPDSADVLFLCNVYHHLEGRTQYFASANPVLRPGGRIVIIDFYHDHRSGDVGFPRRHLVARQMVVREMAAAGYGLAREHDFLTRQYFLEFTVAD